ncbi:MAG: ATP synthase subunit I [Pontibacterium sp.]
MSEQLTRPRGNFRTTRRQTLKVYLFLCVIGLIVSSVLTLKGFVYAYSSLLGVIIFIVPHLYFAHKAFDARVQGADKVLKLMYISEIWKVALTIIGFALAFKFVEPISPLSIFLVYVLMHLLHMGAQMKLNKRFLKL